MVIVWPFATKLFGVVIVERKCMYMYHSKPYHQYVSFMRDCFIDLGYTKSTCVCVLYHGECGR